MHPTIAQAVIQSRVQDLHAQADRERLAASVKASRTTSPAGRTGTRRFTAAVAVLLASVIS